jgi:hypothetical protein
VFYRKHDPGKTAAAVAGIVDKRRGAAPHLPDLTWAELCAALQRKYADGAGRPRGLTAALLYLLSHTTPRTTSI